MTITAENKIALTRRSYTLRLRNAVDGDDQAWKDQLWKTHEAVNRGARVFGDWLLTMRGGITHALAEGRLQDNSVQPVNRTAQEIKARRVLLALSWLSVESARGSPKEYIVPLETEAARGGRVRWNTVGSLREILQKRGVVNDEIESWVSDCSLSLSSAIREDAVWVNRAKAFDDQVRRMGCEVSQEDIWDFLGGFFGSPEAYLKAIELTRSEGEATDERSSEGTDISKTLHQAAGRWLSRRFGTGKGAEFARNAQVYEGIAGWASRAKHGMSGTAAISSLAQDLAEFQPPSQDLGGVLKLTTGPSHRSSTRNLLKSMWSVDVCTSDHLLRLKTAAEIDATKCTRNIGSKGERGYATAILRDVEFACGFTYLQESGPSRHWNYTVMLDLAARRVSMTHSWIKRAEAERRRFARDADRINLLPAPGRDWLERFCARRSDLLGALEPYHIRKRAIDGWEDVLAYWSSPECGSHAERASAVRNLQADPRIEKFGDSYLFESLAAKDATCVWMINGEQDATILLNYVSATEARAKSRQFKVPAYRHVDPLRNPVFCQFGRSAWGIKFSVHEAGRRVSASGSESKAPVDVHGLRLTVSCGNRVASVPLRWSSKRLVANLSLRSIPQCSKSIAVSRADRLGRAAVGADSHVAVRVMQVFEQSEWNGLLRVPRRELDELAGCLERAGGQWTPAALKKRRGLHWLISFSARLHTLGPWMDFAKKHQLMPNPRCWPHAMENKKRQRAAKLVLARLPGLRILSVNLTRRYAAACAVWESVPTEEVRVACSKANVPLPDELSTYLHLSQAEGGKAKKIVYRRIAADIFPDGQAHPSPWARLDRQFFIKLQGENHDEEVRKASPAEIERLENLEREVGFRRCSVRSPAELAVDRLMSEAIGIMRRAFGRHADSARIAFNLTTTRKYLPGAQEATLSIDDRMELIANTLLLWKQRFGESRWCDQWAETQWNRHIRPLVDSSLSARHEPVDRDRGDPPRVPAWPAQLRVVATTLCRNETLLYELSSAWATRWKDDDEAWRRRLAWMRDWLRPRGIRADTQKKFQSLSVGGLSLTRIANFESFYRLQVAWATRPEPDDIRKNVVKTGNEFSSRILTSLRHIREGRIKQLASRIVEAALGVGIETHRHGSDRKRPRERVANVRFAPCHAVVIGNLRNGLATDAEAFRQEGQPIGWAVAKLRKRLAEACELHGLQLREISSRHMFRQDSRTGAAGVRCGDIPINEFLHSARWTKVTRRSAQRQSHGRADAWDRHVVALSSYWSEHANGGARRQTIRIPLRDGPTFISTSEEAGGGGIDADLNAAANIGLKALRDPDWPGSWWNIPCDEASLKPLREAVDGCQAIDCAVPLQKGDSKMAARQKETHHHVRSKIVNLWHTPSGLPIHRTADWQTSQQYWSETELRAIDLLTRANMRA